MFARDKLRSLTLRLPGRERCERRAATKQTPFIANLGRKEVVVARGDLDRRRRSVARLAQRSIGAVGG